KEKSSAKQTYEKALVEKKKTSLLEKMSDTNYKVSLGNIEPDESITIKFTYITVVNMTDNGFKIVFPTNIAPIYTGSFDHASKDIDLQTSLGNLHYRTSIPYKFELNLDFESYND